MQSRQHQAPLGGMAAVPAAPAIPLALAVFAMLLAVILNGRPSAAADGLAQDVAFHASFDRGFNADRARGDPAAKVVGEVGVVEGISGKAVCVGAKGWLEYGLADNINKAGGAGSIEMWVKPLTWDGAAPREAPLLTADYENEGKAPELAGLFRLYNLPGVARLTFIAGPYPNDRPENQVAVQSEITHWRQGQWHHVVVTWDGASLAMYVDGELSRRQPIKVMGSGENPRFEPALGRAFTVGGKPWGECGDTALDEVTIYNSALLPEDVIQRFSLGAHGGGSAQGQPARSAEPVMPAAGVPATNAPGVALALPARMVLSVPMRAATPSIDGVVAEEEWGGASSCNVFVRILEPEARLSRYDNRLLVRASAATLYLGLVSEFRGGVGPTAEAQAGSGNVFNDDCFEILLSRPGDADTVHQYDVNASGQLDHYRARPAGKLAPTEAKAAAQVSANQWSAELAIPLQELGVSRPAESGDRLLIQVVRSYKVGSVTERSAAARSINAGVPQEEYVGFPWNSSFLNVEHYAELHLVDAAHAVTVSVDASAYLETGALSVRGTFGPAWLAALREGLFTLYAPGREPAVEKVAVQPDGSYALAKPLPEQTGDAILSFAEGLCVRLPLGRTAPALRIRHTIFSHNNTLQVALDMSDLPSLKPGDVRGDVRIMDRRGKVRVREKLRSCERTEEKRTLSIANLPAGRYTIECSLRGSAGAEVASASQPFEVFRELPGEGSRLGITDDVPAPWTPVQVSADNQVSVWGRTYDFGGGILPQQVVTLGTSLLAAPIAYEAQLLGSPGRLVHTGALSVVEKKPGAVVLRGVSHDADLEIRQTVTIEFDGMIRCDAEVRARKPMLRFALRIPVREDRAKLFHAAAWRGKFTPQIWSPLEIGPGFRWSSMYLYPCLWVADLKGGLCWFAASDREWVVDRKRDKLVVTHEGMLVSFVDTESTATTRLRLTYGLQAFPTRPPRPDWREFGRVLEGKWQSVFTPDRQELQKDGLVPEAYFRELMRDRAKRAVRAVMLPFGNFPRSVKDYTSLTPEVYDFAVQLFDREQQRLRDLGIEYVCPYLTPTYCSDAIPEWKFYWSNWTMIPKARFDEDGESGVCIANPQWRDFWLQAFHDYVQEHRVKAVFHDMAGPYAEEGTLNGLGYTRNGVRYPEYPIWECRDAFKRAYIVHRQLFPDAMSFMNYGDFTPPVHSFADFLLAAERYETRAERSIYDLDGDGNLASFTYQTSLPFGPKAMHNGWLKYAHAMEEREPTIHMYGLVLLHDLVQWNINENPQVRSAVHALKKGFGIGYDRTLVFLPYWDNGGAYRVDSKDIVISFYRKDSRLLAIVVNKSMKRPFAGTVELGTAALGVGTVQSVRVYDPLSDTYAPAAGGSAREGVSLGMEIQPTLFKAVLVN